MNYSKQRESMLRILRSTKSHPTANEIYMEMRKTDSKISLGTVYRNLNLLCVNGIILRIDTNHDSVHYDGCVEPHCHFVCSDCKRVFDLELDTSDLDDKVREETDFTVSGHSLVFYGKCNNCKD